MALYIWKHNTLLPLRSSLTKLMNKNCESVLKFVRGLIETVLLSTHNIYWFWLKLFHVYLTAKETHIFHYLFNIWNNHKILPWIILMFDRTHTQVVGHFRLLYSLLHSKLIFLDNVKKKQKPVMYDGRVMIWIQFHCILPQYNVTY